MKTLLGSARIPFLILTPAIIFLSLSYAIKNGHPVDYLNLLLCLLAALCAHVSVNYFNEYFDYHSGLDFNTKKTPFSGGSGALTSNPNRSKLVLICAQITMATTIVIGIYFSFLFSPWLVPIGLVGIGLVCGYTPWINQHPFLCLIAPGLGFGPVMLVGTYMVLTGEFKYEVLFISFVPFFLVNNLLLLNQFPDINADKQAGRKHFPITYGTRVSSFAYLAFLLACIAAVVLMIQFQLLPRISYWVLIPLLIGLTIFIAAYRNNQNIDKLIPFMGLNVLVTVVTPILLAGIILSNS